MYGNLTNEIYIYTVKHDNSEHPFNEFKLTVIPIAQATTSVLYCIQTT